MSSSDHPPQGAVAKDGESQQPAFERLLLVVTFLLIFIMAARTPLDSDMWWHLSAGEEMLRSGRVLLTDVFSFTRVGASWTNPYWLTQSIMAALFRWQGYLGLGAAVAVLAVLSMGVVSLQCEAPVSLKSAALLLSSIVASTVWSPRPQLVSQVLLALTGYLLYLYKWKGKDALWGLPLVFVLWGNVHGGYPLGLILIGAIIAGEVLNHVLAFSGEAVLPWSKILRLVAWGVLCGLAVLANPNGLKIWLLPFQTVDMRVLQQYIPEWASPNFHLLIEQSLLWLLLAVITVIGISGRVMDGSDLLVFLGFAFMALLAKRNFGPFAIVAAPILCRYGTAALVSWQGRAAWLQKIKPRESNQLQAKPANKIVNLSLVAVLGVAAIFKLYSVTHPALVNSYLQQSFPTRAVQWVLENKPTGRLLNEYNWGGYLQWSLRGYLIFIDGRTDLFNDEVVGEWIAVVNAEPGWQETLERYAVDLVMLEPGRPLQKQLAENGWKQLYVDQQAVIFGR